MKQKKKPERMCVGCQQMKDKKQLTRVVKPKEEKIFIDPTGKKAGRGAYICKDIECFNTALKSRRLEKSLKTSIPEEIYDELRKQLLN